MDHDMLDNLLRDSDEEDLPTSVQIPQPRLISMKNRLSSPVRKAKINHPGHLGTAKTIKGDTTYIFSDPFFGIRVKSGVVDMEALTMLCKDMNKVGVLSKSIPYDSSWMSVGVIVDKSGILKSSNGNEYMIWKLHDLKNCGDKARKTLLFGDAVKEHWKCQKGSVIVLLSPQMITDDKTAEATFKVSKSNSIVNIGNSADLGKCKGGKQDGTPCSAFVNQSKCEMCVYHASREVRKLAARRGTFSQSILIPNKNVVTTTPYLMHQAKPKTIISASTKNKEDITKAEKEALTSIVSEKTTFSLGARCLASLSNCKIEGSSKKNNLNAASFRQFLNLSEVKVAKKVNERTAKEEDAVKRALRILEGNINNNGEEKKNLKRRRENEENGEKVDKINDGIGRNRVLELLAKRSRHSNEALEMENEIGMDYLDSLEKKEAIESMATECTQLNEVKVFSCSTCGYTARNRSGYCMKESHTVKSHLSSKRFFKCKECSYKTSTFSLLPTRRCQKCKGDNWKRVTMLEERKLVLETEKLELRGEERTFVD
ncbi:hypothetical protein PFISCL1PPCAC_19840 [Pristionchus fissidentatus]|uniref:Protein MCM10 homolog n=1 Tax=Pristionchus fissidentatus TaxID=1538716 RepID=A0AAV5WDW3_9BILA|nr:hypothetical protein PFISCL1PPCAC_19840 [Pristionchus fissidentatus]